MSRKLICDFCSTEFPDYNADVDTSKSLNWVEQLDKTTDICAECAILVVHNLVEHGVYNTAALYSMRDGRFPEPVSAEPPKVQAVLKKTKVREVPPVDPDLFEPDDFPLEPPDEPTSFDPPDVFHLTMHGAGLNPEHELLFQTVDEAKDYAAKNAQVFPEAAYRLTCPDGVVLQGDSNVAWTNPHAPLDPSEVRVNWKVAGKVASQPKKA